MKKTTPAVKQTYITNEKVKRILFLTLSVLLFVGQFSFVQPSEATTKKVAVVTTTKKKVKVLSASEEKVAEKELFRLVNNYRAKNKVKRLKGSVKLNKAAKTRSVEIQTKFDHVRPDGRAVRTTATDAGLKNFWDVGENIASNTGYKFKNGKEAAKKLFDQWLKSPGHRQNMLYSDYDYMAFGVTTTEHSVYGATMFLVK